VRLIVAMARRLRDQRGFTTVTLMGAFAVGSMLVAGGFAAVQPDIQMSRESQDYKQAYGGADAGVQWYLSGLVRDNSFYTQCTEVADPNEDEQAPVNPEWDGDGADPRVWRNLPGGDEAQYTVELLPAPGYEECDPDDQYSMIDASGNMRLRITGRSRDEARSIIVTLRRRNFIDFIYFTHFETLDPLAYSSSGKRNWASSNCNQFREEREEEYSSSYGSCTEIQFASGDVVSGPLHTNDSIWVCGGATFGRTAKDAIELNGEAPGYIQIGSCTPTPNMLGEVDHPSGQMALPPSNQELLDIVDPAYVFKGRTKIKFNGETMTVRRKNASTEETLPLPPNGLIYVKNDGNCSVGYAYSQTYTYNSTTDFVSNDPASSACGNAWVKGNYSSEVTIAADNDVIVYGDLERNEDNLLFGLIANNFVRVFHPVDHDECDNDDGNRTGSLSDPVIEAAILALNHSFIVDNWYCGDGLGTLTVEGAIAQRYRGPVGQGVGGSSADHGYIKDYRYNDRLKFREPPYFLDPVQSAWRVARQNEQVPATK
jgi:hypothetical protein